MHFLCQELYPKLPEYDHSPLGCGMGIIGFFPIVQIIWSKKVIAVILKYLSLEVGSSGKGLGLGGMLLPGLSFKPLGANNF